LRVDPGAKPGVGFGPVVVVGDDKSFKHYAQIYC
jgi:hypothetical protein